MKLKQYIESYSALVSEFLQKQPNLIPAYEAGDFPRAERVVDLQQRFRWDIFWILDRVSKGKLSDHFFAGDANSDHVDTLLRKCTPKITQKF